MLYLAQWNICSRICYWHIWMLYQQMKQSGMFLHFLVKFVMVSCTAVEQLTTSITFMYVNASVIIAFLTVPANFVTN